MVLVAFVLRQLSDAFDKKPYGRCGKDHMLNNCPMDPEAGYKGSVWRHWKQELRNEAEKWLKANKEYKPDAIPAKKFVERKVPVNADGFQGYGGTETGASTNAKPHQKLCWTEVKDYRNATSAIDMHYPESQDLDNTEPIGNGRSWPCQPT